jgi:hypothetical protein
MFRDQICWNAVEIKPLATTQNRRENFLRLGGREDKFHMFGRLFEGLQKRIKRRWREHVYFIDQINFVTPLRWRVPNVFAELPYVFDAVVAGTVNLNHIEAIPGGNLTAVIAFAARGNGRSFHAIERFSKDSRGRCFADPARANKEIRMSKPVLRDRILQRTRDMCLAHQVVERLRSIFSGENLVTHAFNLTKKPARERLRS